MLVSVKDDRKWMTYLVGLLRRRGALLLKISEKLCTSHNLRHSYSAHRCNRDPSGALNFSGKAVVHAKGVDFSNGASFAINMTQLQLEEELGRGNYGTVKKVLHKPTKVYMAMKVRISTLSATSAEYLAGNTPRA